MDRVGVHVVGMGGDLGVPVDHVEVGVAGRRGRQFGVHAGPARAPVVLVEPDHAPHARERGHGVVDTPPEHGGIGRVVVAEVEHDDVAERRTRAAEQTDGTEQRPVLHRVDGHLLAGELRQQLLLGAEQHRVADHRDAQRRRCLRRGAGRQDRREHRQHERDDDPPPSAPRPHDPVSVSAAAADQTGRRALSSAKVQLRGVARPSARASAIAQPYAMSASPLAGSVSPTSSTTTLPPPLTAAACSTSSGAPWALRRKLRSS